MLPFLKKKDGFASSSVINIDRKPDEPNDSNAGIEACAQDLISAVHAKDASAAASAIRAAFEMLESEPHEEGPHVEPHSYDASKQK